MISLPSGARVWLACGRTDMRKGMDGLAMLAQQVLTEDPFGGALFAFRGKRGGLVKLLWYDGQGMCLFSKRLETGPLRLAGDRDRPGVADPGATVDAAGGDRLAHAAARAPPGTGGLSAAAHARFIGSDSQRRSSAARVFTAPTVLPDDPATLQLILRAALAEIERLRLLIAGLQRNRFGRRSERLDDAAFQQGVEDLEQSLAEQVARLDAASSAAAISTPEPTPRPPRTEPAKRNRGALPAHLPRVEVVIDVDDKACPCCGGTLHRHRRRPGGDAGLRACPAAGPGDPPAAVWLPGLRGGGRAGARAGASDRRRHGHRGAAGACAGQQIRRPSAAVSPGADLRPPGRDAGSFHVVQLGGPRLLVAGAAARAGAEHRADLAQGVRRRHHTAGARSRARTHQDRTTVVLRGRQPALAWAGTSGRCLCL